MIFQKLKMVSLMEYENTEPLILFKQVNMDNVSPFFHSKIKFLAFFFYFLLLGRNLHIVFTKFKINKGDIP